LQESEMAACLAAGGCLPHPNARLQAEGQRLRDQGELAKVRHEVLLDAGQTYFDLLTARRGEAVAREIEQLERRLLKYAEDGAKTQAAARALVAGLKATLENRQVTLSKLRHQGNAASAKLAYLLGLPPGAAPVPADAALTPIELVDSTLPTEALVAQ